MHMKIAANVLCVTVLTADNLFIKAQQNSYNVKGLRLIKAELYYF